MEGREKPGYFLLSLEPQVYVPMAISLSHSLALSFSLSGSSFL